jgi:hypothetical protein
MRHSGSASRPTPDAPDPAYEIARELHGILPFGARADALARCPRLAERIVGDAGHEAGQGAGREENGERTASAVVDAIESFSGPVHLPDHHAEPLTPALVRRMLHVLLATRDLGWPGTDAPLSVRRVAAADLFFDDTQTVLSDDDWKGPNGVEFALLTALAGRVCRTTSRRTATTTAADEGRARDAGGEMLGQLHRVRRPRGL